MTDSGSGSSPGTGTLSCATSSTLYATDNFVSLRASDGRLQDVFIRKNEGQLPVLKYMFYALCSSNSETKPKTVLSSNVETLFRWDAFCNRKTTTEAGAQ